MEQIIDLCRNGSSGVLVSHDWSTVSKICKNAMLLDEGKYTIWKIYRCFKILYIIEIIEEKKSKILQYPKKFFTKLKQRTKFEIKVFQKLKTSYLFLLNRKI